MLTRRNAYFGLIFFVAGMVTAGPVWGQYNRTVEYYLDLGRQAVSEKDFEQAAFYYQAALAVDPQSLEARKFFQALTPSGSKSSKPVLSTQPSPAVTPPPQYRQTKDLVQPSKPVQERVAVQSSAAAPVVIPSKAALPERTAVPTAISLPRSQPSSAAGRFAPNAVLPLDDSWWSRQPNTVIEIPLNQTITLDGKDIQRFLLITEDIFKVEREDRNRLRVTAMKVGTSFFHVWDARGRWTFNLKSVLPLATLTEAGRNAESSTEVLAKPFSVAYSNNWDSVYLGGNIPDMQRRSLTYTQWAGIFGETPYGSIDASLNTYKYPASTEIVGQRVGWTNGHIGNFKDFTIRGYDTFVDFSSLSLAGRSFRGALLDAYAFDRNINYTVFHGQDRASYLFSSPGIIQDSFSYLQGAQVTLFPDGENKYSANYSRGYGSARPETLKDRVYSVETDHRLGAWRIGGEVGYDEDKFGRLARSLWTGDKSSLGINFHDIELGYQTINGRPVGGGEVGGDFHFNWDPGNFQLTSGMNIYREREDFNPDKSQIPNFESNIGVQVPLSTSEKWNTSAYYDNTPQLINPRESLRLTNTYTKDFNSFNNRYITFFLGNTLQGNRFKNSPSSEFNRFSLSSGLRLPVLARWSYYVNYEYSWVEDLANNQWTNPQVINTGLSYSRQLTSKMTGNFAVDYRYEQESAGAFSFLSNEDSVRAITGISYRPVTAMEVFLDTSLMNVMPKSQDSPDYYEADLRFGMRSDWNLPFRWNPTGTVKGMVFNDANANGRHDQNETGLFGIVLQIGRLKAVTDGEGFYKITISAKEVEVRPSLDSVPVGYLLTTAERARVKIEQGGTSRADFGFSSRSGIYGVVFVDDNRNGRPDPGEKMMVNTRLTLDGKSKIYSDTQGGFRFNNLSAGSHQIKLDINSVPLDFIPLIRLDSTVNVSEGSMVPFNVPLRRR